MPARAITPKTLVDRGNVAASQREVTFHVEFGQSGGQAILSHIAKFQTWHLLPPIKVARSAVAAGMLSQTLLGPPDNSQSRWQPYG